jgi:hypothetical protein
MKHPKRAHDPVRQAALDAYDAKLNELHETAWKELRHELGGTAAMGHDLAGYRLYEIEVLAARPVVDRA